MKEFDYIVYIGRFQPPHIGHIAVLKYASQLAENVICLIGSAYSPRNIRNPFSKVERQEILLKTCIAENIGNVSFYGLHDHLYSDNGWITEVQSTVNKITGYGKTIGIIGFDKGYTTRYLKWFPQWKSINFNEVNLHGLDATTIRELMYENRNIGFIKSVVPDETLRFFNYFLYKQEWIDLCDEYEFIQRYRKAWELAPYPPTFVTADAVVVQDGHILLVKRKAAPGKGLHALPGGFVQHDEMVEQAALRELVEETKIKVPPAVLRGSIKNASVFDSPVRSLRGRTITHAFYIELPSTGTLPKVTGADDAEKAFWLPISEIDELKLFEDHFHIIKYFIL